MDLVSNLSLGLSTALQPTNLGIALLGCLIGTLIGVLPGVGSLAALSMLLPVTYYLEPSSALIMLAGIYYGAQYGGSTTAILVNLPGESSAVVTCLDGHQMARQGRAGAALAIAALGSFFAGTIATLIIALLAVPMSGLAMRFGAAEYFSLIVLGLIAAVVMAHGSVLKAIAMVVLGLLISLAGTDLYSNVQRFTFGAYELYDGIDFVPLAVGLFGLGSVISRLAGGEDARETSIVTQKIDRLWPTRNDFRQAWPAVLRGTGIGSILGVLPGGGSILSSFASYAVERRIAKDPSRFGRGAVEGLAGPESANNAGAQTAFIPMLTLGIPPNPVLAVMIGAMMIHGIQPGPQVIAEEPELFWGLIASMWIGNAMLLVINLPLVGIWVKLLKIPYRLMFPAIVLFSCIGVYSVNNSVLDIALAAGFGALGYILTRLDFEPAPLALGFVLGPLMEESLRRTMLLSRGDPLVFFERPISLTLMSVALIVLIVTVLPSIRSSRRTVFSDSDD